MTVICFVDVETTGTDYQVHELWEVGLVRREVTDDGPGEDLEFVYQVYPDLSRADPRALQIGRFYQRIQPRSPGAARVLARPYAAPQVLGRYRTDIGPGTVASIVAAELARLLDGSVLVAVNVDFDATFIGKFLRMHGQCPTWDYHKVEVLSLGAGRRRLPPPWKSNTVAEALAVPEPPPEQRHTAIGDARMVRDIFDAVYAPDPAPQEPPVVPACCPQCYAQMTLERDPPSWWCVPCKQRYTAGDGLLLTAGRVQLGGS